MSRPNRMQRFWIGVVSVVMSMLLFLQVTAAIDETSTKEFECLLVFEGLPGGLTIANPITLSKIKADATGLTSKLESLDSSAWQAKVDLSKAVPGVSSYPVRLTGPANVQYEVRAKQTRIQVEISRIKEVEVPVIIEERGTPPTDLTYAGSTASPAVVRVRGPESVTDRIKLARAWLELQGLKPGVAPEVRIELIDADGRIIRQNVTMLQDRVIISPKVAAAPASSDAFVRFRWTGKPKFGYEVVDWETIPNVIRLTGRSAELGSVKVVETETYNLEGIAADREAAVKIKVPAGLNADRVEVRLKIRVRKTENINPDAQQPDPNG